MKDLYYEGFILWRIYIIKELFVYFRAVYFSAGMKFNKASLKQVAHVVADVELDPHIIDVVFTIFDDNGDELLSSREFISVLKERAHRGLEKVRRVFSVIKERA